MPYSIRPEQLKDKVILVTGAGDGIGKVAAITFAKAGATVILLGRTVAKLEQVYDDIKEAGYPEPAIIPLDLQGATEQHYMDMARTIEQQFGRLDGLLHNASILGNLQPFAHIPAEEFAKVMQVNVTAEFLMTKALLPILKLAPTASVVFTSSSVGQTGRSFWGSYAISKFATEGMMQVLADEYENTGLRFNCINPGKTRTKMRASAYPGENPDELPNPADHMPLYVHLMSDDSQKETGNTYLAQENYQPG